MKKGTIFKNLWAGYECYFVYQGQARSAKNESSKVRGIGLHNAHGKWEVKMNAQYYTNSLRDEEHFPEVGLIDIGKVLLNALLEAVGIRRQYGRWIPCPMFMPEEHDTVFAKFKGTDKWRPGMFEKRSDTVLATVEYEDGARIVRAMYTIDGEWKCEFALKKFKVVGWMPYPDPLQPGEAEGGEHEHTE